MVQKLRTREFQLKAFGGNMRCKLLQKRSTGKTTECSKHLRHITIEKNIFLELNRCISWISLKFMKLVILKILFMLGLSNFEFFFKILWPSSTKLTPQQYTPTTNTHTHTHTHTHTYTHTHTKNENIWPPSKYVF